MPSPRPAPLPLSRWSEGWRIAVALVFGLVLWTVQFTEEIPQDSLVPLLDLVVGIGAVIAVHWRRRWPAVVAIITTLATGVSSFAAVASLIAFVSLVTSRRWKPVAVTAVIGAAGTFGYERLTRTSIGWPWWGTTLVVLAVYGIAVLFGLYVGARRELVTSYRERAETAEREQAFRVEQAKLSERARIAREMHDVLAHRISLLSLHAGAMTYRTDLSVEELRASALVVQDNAHQASLDLRDVLGVLRDPGAIDAEVLPATPDRPQPTLADLPALVQEARQAGTAIDVTGDALDGPPPPDTAGRTAYRIIQEALTNARKHAPGAPVSLRLTGSPGGRLDIEVSNPVRISAETSASGTTTSGTTSGGSPALVLGSGLGLVGLAERTTLAGGGLEHGRVTAEHRSITRQTCDPEYRVHAWVPWPA